MNRFFTMRLIDCVALRLQYLSTIVGCDWRNRSCYSGEKDSVSSEVVSCAVFLDRQSRMSKCFLLDLIT